MSKELLFCVFSIFVFSVFSVIHCDVDNLDTKKKKVFKFPWVSLLLAEVAVVHNMKCHRSLGAVEIIKYKHTFVRSLLSKDVVLKLWESLA